MKAEMMKQCCGAEGNPDFGKIKQFMKGCGKHEFSDENISMMKGFCGQKVTSAHVKDDEFNGEMRVPSRVRGCTWFGGC